MHRQLGTVITLTHYTMCGGGGGGGGGGTVITPTHYTMHGGSPKMYKVSTQQFS